MSRALRVLLGRPNDKLLQAALADLERATRKQAIDVQLVGDVLGKTHAVIRTMGLDGDVTAKELYHALRAHVELLDTTTSFVGFVIGNEVVSLNHDDVALDKLEKRQFSERSTAHLRKSLEQEIVQRYRDQAMRPDLLVKITQYIYTEEKV